jgi:ABC-type transport system involved in multi-copper enzyme maturation permease subunit
MTFVWGLRGELTKLRSLRSTYVTLIVMITATAGLGALISLAIAANWHSISPSERALFDPTASSLEGMLFGQLIVAVLGALTISTEYSTGMIRTALAAQPNRIAYLTAKATGSTLVAFAAGVATTVISFLVGQAVLTPTHQTASLSDPGVLRSMVGGGLFLAGCGLFSMTVAVILRHTAAAIAAMTAVLFIGPVLVTFLPARWQHAVGRWLPSTAGSRIMEIRVPAHQFAPWPGLSLFALYLTAAMSLALILFIRRDA